MAHEREPMPLFTRIENRLEEEFPGWLVTRDESGRWSAIRLTWGALYGQSATELRERLLKYTDVEGWT